MDPRPDAKVGGLDPQPMRWNSDCLPISEPIERLAKGLPPERTILEGWERTRERTDH